MTFSNISVHRNDAAPSYQHNKKNSSSIASNDYAFHAIVACTIAVFGAMNYISSGLDAPDVRFGFTSDDLLSVFHEWKEEERSRYLLMNSLDFLFIPCYTTLLGYAMVILSINSSTANVTPFTPLVIVLGICDGIENVVLRKAITNFPLSIDDEIADLGSLAQKIKWILLCFILILIITIGCGSKRSEIEKQKFYNEKRIV